MNLLGIDIGTTHIKAGLFHADGELIRLAISNNHSFENEDGCHFRPDEMWKTARQVINEVTVDFQDEIASIGITSMAESGLLLNKDTGEYLSEIIPWFDRRTERISEEIGKEIDSLKQFQKTGLRNNYKHGLAKILWLKKNRPNCLTNAKWLSTSDFLAYKLTGEIGTDYTLAARTFAFRMDKKEWDIPLIRHFGLDSSLFPDAKPSGTKMGVLSPEAAGMLGLKQGVPVAVSGHDHVCAALAAGAVKPGIVLDSMGTAETIVGSLEEKKLTQEDYESGFNFGCHVLSGRYFWMGAIQSSGGSVEWIRNQLSDNQLTYDAIASYLDQFPSEPTGILYYPYLAGSGSPQPDAQAKGAFIGLKSTHRKGELLRAVLEGTAYEFEHMKRTAAALGISRVSELIAVGGGSKNKHWLKIKADVSNCPLSIPSLEEASLLGAAAIAGLGCGIYKNEDELLSQLSREDVRFVTPDVDNYHKYRIIFEEGYMSLQQPLRTFYQKNL
ncbi:FGGY-family carbohydrate kinase [Sediminibacillus massiliensis]|uniref:FGGY-family carbohydrate kinase n=1 Tax=Sediminibacillus massiliensis TaxID=1926277 RepID=UPI0009888419|nr:FGGY family carbohydrate kinase [Sediminibacillus massiliensis]